MKTLAAFAGGYDSFYVPTFVVKVGGRDLVRELFLTITAVEVELKLNTTGRFSFTVASAFDWKEREFLGKAALERVDLLDLFAFGAEVDVSIGYGEPSRLAPVISGIVTEIGTSFAETGTPALTVSGYDALYGLGIGKASGQWDRKKPSDAVRDVAAKHSLPVRVTGTEAPKERIDQCKESDRDFVARMADLAKAIFYVRDGKLSFGPRRNDTAAIAELAWGEGLASFSPTANLARQVTAVEVHGWSAAEGRHVVGKAQRGDEDGVQRNTESGAQKVAEAFSNRPAMSISAAVHSQQEADERAKAILEQRAQDFVTGDADCIGLPELVPDAMVDMKGVGRVFSKPYYITEATHTVDAKGYRTHIKVQEPSI